MSKPKTQTGFASFSMHELAELITNVHVVSIKPDKPKQNDRNIYIRTNKEHS
jgi:hypothetical protein